MTATGRCVCLIRRDMHYRRSAFEAGLRAAGFDIVGSVPNPGPGDLLVTWNRYGANDLTAQRFEQGGAAVVVVENGYSRRGLRRIRQGPRSEWRATARDGALAPQRRRPVACRRARPLARPGHRGSSMAPGGRSHPRAPATGHWSARRRHAVRMASGGRPEAPQADGASRCGSEAHPGNAPAQKPLAADLRRCLVRGHLGQRCGAKGVVRRRAGASAISCTGSARPATFDFGRRHRAAALR